MWPPPACRALALALGDSGSLLSRFCVLQVTPPQCLNMGTECSLFSSFCGPCLLILGIDQLGCMPHPLILSPDPLSTAHLAMHLPHLPPGFVSVYFLGPPSQLPTILCPLTRVQPCNTFWTFDLRFSEGKRSTPRLEQGSGEWAQDLQQSQDPRLPPWVLRLLVMSCSPSCFSSQQGHG